jgi:hypothetical protein
MVALILGAAARSEAVQITIVNTNGPNEGFNDPTQASPVGGNPGTTVGQQRVKAFEYAAAVWSAALGGNVPVAIEASFIKFTQPDACTPARGVLGATAPLTALANYPNAPRPDVWYPKALADQIAGRANGSGNAIRTMFNADIGSPACLTGDSWYYGLDGKPGDNQFDLVAVALHEFAHGLGFVTLTDTQTGAQLATSPTSASLPDVWEFSMFDLVAQKHWSEMSNTERAASAKNPRKLVWDGPSVTAAAPGILPSGRPTLTVLSPSSIMGEYLVGTAQFGPELSTSGLSGPLQDTASTACTSALPSLSNKIALLDRGGCAFVVKVKNAQTAGALAVVIVDNTSGSPPPQMGGADPTITIPSVLITQADGQKIRAALSPGPVNVNERLLPGYRGADDNNRVLLYTPIPWTQGSSVSHTDTVSTLLMDPAYTKQTHDLDLTTYLFKDIGWTVVNANPNVSPNVVAPKSGGGCSTAAGSAEPALAIALLLVAIWFAARANHAGRPQSTSSHPR